MADLQWTGEQVAAILGRRDTLLSANAGSGKTTTVVGKILWLLGLDAGVNGDTGEPLPPCLEPCELHEIAAITFTEKAAHDLKRKLRSGIEDSPRGIELRWKIDRAFIGTIHSFCASLLREHALRLGIDPTFTILDERETRSVQDDLTSELVLERLEAQDEGVAEIFRRHGLRGYTLTNGTVDLLRIALRDLRWRRDRYALWTDQAGGRLDANRLRMLAPSGIDANDEAVLRSCDTLYRLARIALHRWEEYQREENVRDYDGLILDTRGLLVGPHGAPALRSIRDRFRILVIDEFQDTDRAQADIALNIGRAVDRPQLLFVGDPKQSIYRFRGADISVWNEVAHALKDDGELLSLTSNFRSQPELIEYLNAVGEEAIEETGRALENELPQSRVRYSPLRAGLESSATASVEFLSVDDGNADSRRVAEGEQVARRIRELVENGETIVDPDDGQLRPCRYSDIAVLYRGRNGLKHYQRMLAVHGVPVFHPAQGGLADQQEIADVVNALRLLDNPADDLAAFGFLRSPFVGLRDEVVARIALERGSRSLLRQSRAFLDEVEWWAPPEGEELRDIERDALHTGLGLVDELIGLAARLPLDELLAHLLDRSGYRLHLMLLGENREPLANLQTLVRIAEQYRKHPIGDFLDIWSRWSEQDTGLPQAPLYSADDDVVTLTTIHRAKGLEWPVVFLIDTISRITSRTTNNFWSDPDCGPLLAPKTSDQGPRAKAIINRYELEETAEEARLLYVATTRAKDRLVITGPAPKKRSHLQWLTHGSEVSVVSDRSCAAELPPPAGSPEVGLGWLDRLRTAPLPHLAELLPAPPFRHLSSATEVMLRERDRPQWELRYVHGVEPVWAFARNSSGKRIPERVRGTIIHGALERYPPGPLERAEMEEELARILEEVIGELEMPELEPYLTAENDYRNALEREIAHVVSSEEWGWYTAGEHYRELPFLHIVGQRLAYVGAFDLYRPEDGEAAIIDFKTHDLPADRVAVAAKEYSQQARLYRDAAEVRSPARVMLHFTKPGAVVEM
ncbi:MAG: AAA family ATPase [Gemmatimonas sp.]|nr:AAA family ATPase [Gemmatimonas sp.]